MFLQDLLVFENTNISGQRGLIRVFKSEGHRLATWQASGRKGQQGLTGSKRSDLGRGIRSGSRVKCQNNSVLGKGLIFFFFFQTSFLLLSLPPFLSHFSLTLPKNRRAGHRAGCRHHPLPARFPKNETFF